MGVNLKSGLICLLFLYQNKRRQDTRIICCGSGVNCNVVYPFAENPKKFCNIHRTGFNFLVLVLLSHKVYELLLYTCETNCSELKKKTK